ncbi:mycothiol transferase [Corynebacterium sp. 335C]
MSPAAPSSPDPSAPGSAASAAPASAGSSGSAAPAPASAPGPAPASASVPDYAPDPSRPVASHALQLLDRLARIVLELDDGTANATPAAPAMNSPAVLLRHVLGSARYWLDHVCLGHPNVRDREGEFSWSGPVADLAALFPGERAVIAAALDEIAELDPASAPASPPTDRERWWAGTVGGVVVHVLHEVAQHLGHLEITRDVLLAGLPREQAAPAVVDLVIAELQAAGHPADDVRPDAVDGGHVIATVDGLRLATADLEAACRDAADEAERRDLVARRVAEIARAAQGPSGD